MGSTGARDHLRAMPRPIHRFSSARMGVVDGSIFAFAVSGTNPTALVVIALRENSDDGKKRHWEYGVVGMTADAASIYLDDHVVWSKKADYTKRVYENWYFHQQVKLNAENAGTALRDSSTLQPTP